MEQDKPLISRRGIIQTGLIAGVGLAGALRGGALARAADVIATSRGKAFRVAHLTDMHVLPGPSHSGDGYAMALQSLQTLNPRPDLLITGGDHVMDSMETQMDRVGPMWDLYQQTLKDSTDLPVRPVIGNHDCFGWAATSEKIPSTTVGYGKALYCDKMGLEKTYYSFDSGGWHFICLDNISHVQPVGYRGMFDEEQEQWLKDDLEKTPKQMPICLLTHIPILSVCTYFDSPYKGYGYLVDDSVMHHDAHKLITLLRKYNVKLCISGHIHMVDRIEYLGITFICDGAVSGNWWKGPREEFPEGYGVFDFYPDGTFEHQYHAYGWKATLKPKA